MTKKKPVQVKPPIETIQWGAIEYENAWLPNKGLGPTDGMFGINDKWPIYNIDLAHPLCLYQRFKEQLHRIQGKKDTIDGIILDDYTSQHPDIFMELLIFGELLKESMYFKCKGKIYCYCVDDINPAITEFGQFMKLRFLFNPFEVLGLTYNIEG